MKLRFEKIEKRFSNLTVLKEISLEANSGEVIALMGENGAGKSTLMKILAGVYPHGDYSGDFFIDEKRCKFKSTFDAKKSGIAMIHQELGLFDDLTVAENILLDELRNEKTININQNLLGKIAKEFLNSIGFEIDVEKKVSELSTGQKQLVEIARALRANAKILILDEPTSALSENEAKRLFLLLKKLKDKIIFYVSHRMDEITHISDRVIVLRDGIIAGVKKTCDFDRNQIIQWMIDRKVENIFPKKKIIAVDKKNDKKPLLLVKNLKLTIGNKVIFDDINFHVSSGEILGLGGLMGAGRSEIVSAIFGLYANQLHSNQFTRLTGEVEFDGKINATKDPNKSWKNKIAFLSEDRKQTGLFLNLSAQDNITIKTLKKILAPKEEQSLASHFWERLNIHGPGLKHPIQYFSGGNQQKAALAKCLATNPKLLILDEPTRGVDIKAKIEIYEHIQKLANDGLAIILVSSEMPELLGLSDRIIVIRSGTISETFNPPFFSEKIMHAASL